MLVTNWQYHMLHLRQISVILIRLEGGEGALSDMEFAWLASLMLQ